MSKLNGDTALEEFGTEKRIKPPERLNRGVEATLATSEGKSGSPHQPPHENEQWTISGSRMFMPCGQTHKKLPPGKYDVIGITENTPIFKALDTKVDGLIKIQDSINDSILKEIETFWSRKNEFHRRGFLHRRGYLLYGPQGSGKTAIIQQIIKDIIEQGDIVLMFGPFMTYGLTALREVEPERRLVCIFEDIDSIIATHGEDKILSILDGENEVDCVLNLATTNYPGRLDKRVVSRPRRFDRVIKIGPPNTEMRRIYLQSKLKLDDENIDLWLKETEGLSFAALAEAVISVKCLGHNLKETAILLHKMSTSKFSETDLEKESVGFLKGG